MNRGQEDYIKAIFKFTASKDLMTYIKTQTLVDYLKHSRASVNEMIKKLSHGGYVEYKPYVGLRLTSHGYQEAIKMIRKHRLWESFLYKTLGLSESLVHEEAEKLEHATSDLVLEALDHFLKSPEACPHGKLIPTKQDKQ
jgi:DtxR family Mn-dependent transcriptional regulator